MLHTHAVKIMDERHWWFASKLQETFHFSGYDSPTLLEDFLSEPDVVDLINKFLGPGDPCKLFFYCEDEVSGNARATSASRKLQVTPQLSKDVVSQGSVCLYVLRQDTGGEVDITQMEKELFCGELRHSVLSSLASLLSDAYSPLLHSQENWGNCNEDSVTNFLQNFDKLSGALVDFSTRAQILQPILQRPNPELKGDILQQHPGRPRQTMLGEVSLECEALVADWISTIEGLLIDVTDER